MKDYVRVGKIVNTHGVKGCMKVLSLTDEMERFEELEYVYTEIDNKKRNINDVWYRNGMVYLELEDVNSMDDAIKLKESYISIEESQLKELPEDTYYIFDLKGLEVFSTEGDYIGKLKEIFQTGANDVYEVIGKEKTHYIPAIKNIVKEVNIKDKKIIINVVEGLL